MPLSLIIALLLTLVVVCFFVHFEVLSALSRFTAHAGGERLTLALAMSGLIAVHIVEVAMFGAAFYASVNYLKIGAFAAEHSMTAMDYFYYAAETYSSLGYGDIYPLGDIRLLASITPLIGLLLLGWSGAFLSSLSDDMRTRRVVRDAPPRSIPPGN